ncbi:2-oxoacid:acceptor oxidoreductase family protein [Hippea alviniae]|uniref:2-oxoacid:acceptor oxidoreductase family protein n=1 Tax=Hippea alviniae TaxID=1279027 RepID=UPI0003B6E56A|nr:2-oxoacid:acceptor oxidoreductase family protein [Hippea alviniae]
MAFHYELRFGGVGGQGSLTAGTIIAHAAVFHTDYYATQVPTYTSQVRGGAAKADIIISDEPIVFPESTNVDFFLSTHQKAYDAYKGDLKEGAYVLVDSGLVTVPDEDAKKYKVYEYPLVHTAKYEIGNVVTMNILAVGICIGLTEVLPVDVVRETVKEEVPPAFIDMNMKAFDMGLEVGRKFKQEGPTKK